MRIRVLCLLGCVLALGRAVPAAAEDDGWEYGDTGALGEAQDDADDGPPDEDRLAPYGVWEDEPSYGRIWRPVVAGDWRPYVYGRWVWSPYGWTWVSTEPWGCTFHYGRWAFAPVGWVWIPGSVWGPAWVDWYQGDGYVGWAPLGPTVTHVTVVDHYVFVREADFSRRHLPHVVVDHRRVPTQVVRGWPRRRAAAPDRDRIVRVAREPVSPWRGRGAGGGRMWRRGEQPAPSTSGRQDLERPASPGGAGARGWQRVERERRPEPRRGDAGRERHGMRRWRDLPQEVSAPAARPLPPPEARAVRRPGTGDAPATGFRAGGGRRNDLRLMADGGGPERRAERRAQVERGYGGRGVVR